MQARIEKQEILARLEKCIQNGEPIIIATCGAGIIAKCAEIGGADIILVAGSSKSRLMGLPTTPIGHINDDMLHLHREIANVVKNTPLIAGLDAADPTRLDLSVLVEEAKGVGYSGVLNFPSLSPLRGHERRAVRESVGLGFEREVEMMRLARKAGLLTVSYAYNFEDAELMAAVPVDILVAHVGMTGGGLVGSKTASPEQAVAYAQQIINVTKTVNSKIICLAHGGPFSTPESTAFLYEHTDALGFVGASSIERIPVEKAIINAVRDFKGVALRKPTKR